MTDTKHTVLSWDAALGVCFGIVLVIAAWASAGGASALLPSLVPAAQQEAARHIIPGAAAALPTATPIPPPPADCVAPPGEAAKLGFDPYKILAGHRPDVLRFYAKNGWNPATQCVAIFNNWLQHPDGKPAQSAAQFVEAAGWAPAPKG
ncbi:MAG: hypothetical protein M1118_10885 [Chloroflexi bacterium]|nr:hypothetical protein [Chloroflexota bacterium]